MALVKCPECGTEVSDRALACPKCVYPIRDRSPDHWLEVNQPVRPQRRAKISSHAAASLCLFAAVLLAFLNPFMDFMLVRFTGLQLATGHVPSTFISAGSRAPSNEFLGFALAMACVGALLSLFLRPDNSAAGLVRSVLAGLCAFFCAVSLFQFYEDFSIVGTFLTPWFWVALVASASAVAVNVVGAISAVTRRAA